jgi:hypothetical protein
VRASFSDSLLASGARREPAAPGLKAILVEVNTPLLNDIPAPRRMLETAFRVPYALDGATRASSPADPARIPPASTCRCISRCRSCPAAAQPNPGAPQVAPPRNTPDARSLFLGYRYNFASCRSPMTPRIADERVGSSPRAT